MSIEHFVRCDVDLGVQGRCETKAPMPDGHTLPLGWRSLVTYEKATDADKERLMGPFGGIVDAAAMMADDESPEKMEKLKKGTDAMMASLVEKMPAMGRLAHVCDKHEVPAVVKTETHNHGCPAILPY